jgi:hypothetical protein
MRLWIVLSVIYGALVASITWLSFSTNAIQVTDEEFLRELPDQQSRLVIHWDHPVPSIAGSSPWKNDPPLARQSTSKEAFDPSTAKPEPPFQKIEMADGYTVTVSGNATDADFKAFGKAWLQASSKKLSAERWRLVQTTLLIWLVPCIVSLAIGMAVRWIRRGFNQGVRSQ